MKELEEALKDLSLPDIKVDTFKRDLRRSLMEKATARAASGYKFPFLMASAAAGIFGVFLVLFVLKPSFPMQLHAYLAGSSEERRVVDPSPIVPVDNDLTGPSSYQDPFYSKALHRNASLEQDRKFIESWYQQQFSRPAEVRSVASEKIYAIRKFELTGGKQIIVYTELGEDENEERSVY